MKTVTISHIRVCDANGVSSPITVGIPALPAILGAVEALRRRLGDVSFPGTAVVLHKCEAQGLPGFFKGRRVMFPSIERRPLGSDGKTVALEDSVRTRLDVSLVLMIDGRDLGRKDDEAAFIMNVRKTFMSLSFAGGTVTGIGGVWLSDMEDKRLFKALCPGYVLVGRKEEFRELVKKNAEEGKDALETLVDCCALHLDDDGPVRRLSGWKIPISVGYAGITEPETGKTGVRSGWPHAFAEGLVTLGECVFVNRFKVSDYGDLFWHCRQEGNIYECACGTEEL